MMSLQTEICGTGEWKNPHGGSALWDLTTHRTDHPRSLPREEPASIQRTVGPTCLGGSAWVWDTSRQRRDAFRVLKEISLECSSSVQFSRSVVSDSETPGTAARQASLSITSSRSSLKLVSIESAMPSSCLILCPHPTYTIN